MALDTPVKPTTLTAVSKSGFGDKVVDSLTWLATDAPCCRVYNSANISISTATVTALTFDSERYDVGGCHSTSSNTSRITVPSGAGGKWRIGGTATFSANATGIRQLKIRLNGTTDLAFHGQSAVGGGDLCYLNVNCEYALSAGDYVELCVQQTSGGALNALAGGNYAMEFWASWFRT